MGKRVTPTVPGGNCRTCKGHQGVRLRRVNKGTHVAIELRSELC